MDFLILGSCVTRDIFDFVNKNNQVKYYFARESIISVMSDPLAVSIEEINLNSNFQKRVVYYDCNKKFKRELFDLDFDYLIIDLIDERFPVWKIDETYVTASTETIQSGVGRKFPFRTLSLIEKNKIWADACKSFANFIRPFVQKRKVILHEAYWADTYVVKTKSRKISIGAICGRSPFSYVEETKTKKFDRKISMSVKSNNACLLQYYRLLKELLGDNLLVVSNAHRVSDAEHKWGLSPVHYTVDYYKGIFTSIEELIIQP